MEPAQLLTTREVRWFQDGEIPDAVLSWFTSSPLVDKEKRVDRYDLIAAQHGLGLKSRNGGGWDIKRRLRVWEAVELAPGMVGQVEDWVKVNDETARSSMTLNADHIKVEKEILTRRYVVGSDAAGCEAELAFIRVGWIKAWSLCFETFGAHELRGQAFESGIRQFVDDSPLPAEVVLVPGASMAYPAWLSALTAQTA